MAQLVTTKEKYGVSVASRIEPQLAHEIASKAESLGISMAKMISMLIVRGMSENATTTSLSTEEMERYEETILQLNSDVSDLQQDFHSQTVLYSDATAEFIDWLSSSEEEKLVNIEQFNLIMDIKREQL